MTWCPAHFPVLNRAPHGILPPEGFVRLSSAKYRDWQVLAYETAIDKDLLRKERQLYGEWMERHPPAVELTRGRPEADDRSRRGENSADAVSEPREMTAALRRVLETSDGLDGPVVSLTRLEDGSSRVLASAVNSAESAENDLVAPRVEKRGNPPDRGRQTGEINVSDDMLDDDPEKNLHLRYLLAPELDNEERGEGEPGRHDDVYERVPNSLALEDYAHELAFLPDLTDVIPTQVDYSADNVVCSAHSAEQTTRLIRVLQSHEQIMISSGNALPPPVYGVVCDIDVQGHPPIRQRARRVPRKHLKKLYELLKALLKAGLIAFSNSPWASPIVIVLKKNGVDIRLCIDYKLVNTITLMMEYAIPLVDDLLTELDALAGLGFVCALGHFEWLRMPFGLKNAPMIYQRLIDNALRGYVQPKGGWEAFAERIRRVEIEAENQRVRFSTYAEFEPTRLTKFDADRRALAESDPMQYFVDSPAADMFNTGEPDQSSWVPVFERRSFVDDICFGGRTFDECLDTLDRFLKRFAECRISVSFPKSIFAQPKVDYLSHKVTPEGIQADPKKMHQIAELTFPTTKKGMQAFLGVLNHYGRFIQNLAVYGAILYQIKEDAFAPGGDLTNRDQECTQDTDPGVSIMSGVSDISESEGRKPPSILWWRARVQGGEEEGEEEGEEVGELRGACCLLVARLLGDGWEAPEGYHYTAVNGLGDLRIRPTSLRSPSVGVVGVEWEANEFLSDCYTTTGAATRKQGGCGTFLVTSNSTSEQVKMIMTSANTKGTAPVTTGGRSRARPRSANAATKATASKPRSVKFDRVGDQDHGSDDDGSEDGLKMKGPRPILDDEEVDELTMVVGKSGAPRPIARRLGSEFDEVAPARALAPDERPTTGSRPPVNGDTPNAPIDSSGLTQLAEETKRLLEAMGFECAAMPSKVALQIWELGDASAELTRWKRKLKDSFGVRSSTTVRKVDGVDPSTVPLPSTPKKAPAGAGFQAPATKGDVFSKTAESPYFMDSHMISPKKSRGGRRINEGTDDEDDDDDYVSRAN
ncbi:unnamed protein product [Phytophthora fragariaefolia]|uniref:Unnamed protein product n=1 Tax=Phytophthora fragariaefolia TaxID=1490495 RepID=A0A9W7D1J5_9STRA|nr:unnamed protein product [Phytophthora fragariaefolia]